MIHPTGGSFMAISASNCLYGEYRGNMKRSSYAHQKLTFKISSIISIWISINFECAKLCTTPT